MQERWVSQWSERVAALPEGLTLIPSTLSSSQPSLRGACAFLVTSLFSGHHGYQAHLCPPHTHRQNTYIQNKRIETSRRVKLWN